MTETELRRQFEDLSLDPGVFTHREHVRLAWSYLRQHSLLEVLRIFPEGLQRFASSIGQPGLYHETITWALLMIIAERMDVGRHAAWDEFAATNDDLLIGSKAVLSRYYTAEILASPEARGSFRMPDRLG
ncbi:MAG TPA: hypothetical protein VF701_10425 [Thermoanaerobaculia bacterium]